MKMRFAEAADAEKLLEIYSYYVENTAITFEYEIPTVEEFRSRIVKTKERYPFIIAEENGEIQGYCYASAFKNRPAYDWAVETSIYVAKDQKGKGIGKSLYEYLEGILLQQNILNVYACIAYPEQEDEYLTYDSVKFHSALGYRLVGEFKLCGYKFDKWYNMVWMEKMLADHQKAKPIKLFSELFSVEI